MNTQGTGCAHTAIGGTAGSLVGAVRSLAACGSDAAVRAAREAR